MLGLQRLPRNEPQQIVKSPDTPQEKPSAVVPHPDEKQKSAPKPEQKPVEELFRHRVNHLQLARNSNRVRNTAVKDQQLTATQLKQAQAAKDQLMLALRVTSAKLSLAQKKAQSPNQPDLIHNQHKIG